MAAQLARGAELSYKELHAQAEQEFRAAVKLDPQNGALRLALSDALLFQGKGDESIAELREAIRFQPDEAELHQKLSVTLEGVKKDFDGAIADQAEALRLERTGPAGLKVLPVVGRVTLPALLG